VGAVALDANVAIAVFSSDDAHHQRAIAELGAAMDQGALLMGASAYSEILVHALRGGNEDLVDDFIDRLRVEVVPADRTVARLAARLRAENPALRLPDALVVATARARGAGLLTFDDRLRRLAAAQS
jgi:predicted nucleic acid-binding protein